MFIISQNKYRIKKRVQQPMKTIVLCVYTFLGRTFKSTEK